MRASWHVLSPDVGLCPNGPVWKPDGAIPPKVREFGRVPCTADWKPGDLVLIKERQPDYFSKKITQYQVDGGYSQDDSEWTHAAVYVGDDALHVCEATVPGWHIWRGRVVFTSLLDYCGKHELRVRRSNHIDTVDKGWLLVIEAMTQMGKRYDVSRILEIAFKVNGNKNKGFWSRDLFSIGPRGALMCSTLYADSHNRVSDKDIGEKSGVCVPAYLSQCDAFTDIPLTWAQIVS